MLLILISSLMLLTSIFTDATVVIQRQDKAYAECGRSLTLSCKIQAYAFGMSWLTGSDKIMITKCVENKCDQNPNYSGQYNFTFDVELGVFNLTIVKVTTDDDWRVLVCSDGSDFDTQVVKLKGFEPMLLEDLVTGRVIATSGCVYNVTQVSFKWIKISAMSGIEEEFIPTIHYNYTSFCSDKSGCLIDEQIYEYNVLIQASSQSDNGQYYLKTIVIYGNEQKESTYTTNKYIIGRQDVEDEDHDISTRHIAIIIMVAVFILLYIVLIWSCLCRKICKRTSKGDGKLDNPHERKELVKKNLQLANSFKFDGSVHEIT